jgi:valyl-tRNA synthetase
VATLRLGLDVLLRLFAPFLPFISEEVWSWAFAAEKGQPCIHAAPWPSERDFAGIAEPAAPESFDLAVACWGAILKAKSDAAVSMGREVEQLVIAANAVTLAPLSRVLPDVLAAARCHSHALATDDTLADGAVAIRDAVFAERAE